MVKRKFEKIWEKTFSQWKKKLKILNFFREKKNWHKHEKLGGRTPKMEFFLENKGMTYIKLINMSFAL